MVDALNTFLARTTVEPGIRTAYQNGQIAEVLEECGFSPEESLFLSNLPAEDFPAFLKRLFASVTARLDNGRLCLDAWPTDGLDDHADASEERGAA